MRPPLDSFQEFKVQTSGYSAEFGRLAGGVVTMILKSGANQPHGALFEFLRNDALDARTFFSTSKPDFEAGVASEPVRRYSLRSGLAAESLQRQRQDFLPDELGKLSYTQIFTPSLINEFRAGYTRSSRDEAGQNQGIDYNAKFGIPGLPTDPLKVGFPAISITGYAAIGDFNKQPVLFAANNYQLGNTTSFVRGSHAVKFGADLLRSQLNEEIYGSQRGTFAFAGKWTNIGLADLDLGYLNTSSRQLAASPNYLMTTVAGMFVQDDWKITSGLP